MPIKPIGIVVVFVCTFGGFVAMGGKMGVILHALPFEGTIILGSAIGAFLIANSMGVIKDTMKNLNCVVKPEPYSKDDYLDQLCLLYAIFKLVRTKGWLAIEPHIEEPETSALFEEFPKFAHNHDALLFICDYLRIISLGNENPHEIEALMDAEMETIEHHYMHPSHAVQTMADGIPALGIVAAVLGVIKTMSSITEPPEVLGGMIGGALVGTFLGVFVAYGFIGPLATALGAKGDGQVMYYRTMKMAIIAFLQGAAPQVAVEFSRKLLPHHLRPGFAELEERVNNQFVPTG